MKAEGLKCRGGTLRGFPGELVGQPEGALGEPKGTRKIGAIHEESRRKSGGPAGRPEKVEQFVSPLMLVPQTFVVGE